MQLNELSWPLFQIRAHNKLWEDNGVIYIDTYHNKYIIDNKNLSGKTLGMRRLQLKSTFLEDREIYPLNKIFYTISDVINNKHSSKVYIDSAGELFRYKKTTRRKLIYRKVTSTKPLEQGLLCECEGIFRPILLPFLPNYNPKYLGLLVIYGDYLVYELSEEKKKDTWRLV